MITRKVNEFKILALAAVFFSLIMAFRTFRLYRKLTDVNIPEEETSFYLILSIGFLLLLCAAIIGLVIGKKSIVFLVLGLTGILTLIEIFYLQ